MLSIMTGAAADSHRACLKRMQLDTLMRIYVSWNSHSVSLSLLLKTHWKNKQICTIKLALISVWLQLPNKGYEHTQPTSLHLPVPVRSLNRSFWIVDMLFFYV